MKSLTSKIAVPLAVLGVAGGGYFVATNGNGSASAANTAATQEGPGDAGHRGKNDGDRAQELSALATKLGVSTTKLEAAMQKVRGQRAEGRHADHKARDNAEAQALATELGVDANKVGDALSKAESTEHSAGKSRRGEDTAATATSVAQSLSLPQAKVKAALDKLQAAEQSRHAQKRQQLAANLAKELGLPTQKVSDAIAASEPGR